MAYIRYEHILWSDTTERNINSTTYTCGTFFTSQHIFLYESGNYVSPYARYMEFTGKSATATSNDTYVQLYYNTSADTDVSGSFTSTVTSSETITSSTTRNVYRSSSLSLTNTYRYGFKARNEATAVTTSVLSKVAIVIIDDIGSSAPTKTWVEIPMRTCSYTPEATTSTSYADVGDQSNTAIYRHDTSKYGGTLTIYFEVAFKQNSNGTGYVELYKLSDGGASVSGSELSLSSSTYATRARSGSITLENGKDYTIRLKTNNASYQCQLYGAYIIIAQSGTITSTRLIETTTGMATHTNTSYANSTLGFYPPESAHWTSSSPTIKVQCCVRISNASATAYNSKSVRNSSTSESNSELSTTSTSRTVLNGSNAVTLTAGTRYAHLGRTTNSSYTAYENICCYTYDLSWAAPSAGRSRAFIFG